LHPKFAAAVGAVVGAFLMPSTWLLLVALTAGRAALDSLTGAGDPAPTSDPFESLPDDPSLTVPEGTSPGTDAGLPGWLAALLVRVLGCTRRQAEEVFVLAARVANQGSVLDPNDILVGTVKTSTDRAVSVPPAEPAPYDPEDEAQARARRIRALPASEQARALSEMASREGSMRRSVAAGYLEWQPELRIIERTRELVANPAAVML
jgi:hypothetical protein